MEPVQAHNSLYVVDEIHNARHRCKPSISCASSNKSAARNQLLPADNVVKASFGARSVQFSGISHWRPCATQSSWRFVRIRRQQTWFENRKTHPPVPLTASCRLNDVGASACT